MGNLEWWSRLKNGADRVGAGRFFSGKARNRDCEKGRKGRKKNEKEDSQAPQEKEGGFQKKAFISHTARFQLGKDCFDTDGRKRGRRRRGGEQVGKGCGKRKSFLWLRLGRGKPAEEEEKRRGGVFITSWDVVGWSPPQGEGE